MLQLQKENSVKYQILKEIYGDNLEIWKQTYRSDKFMF